MDDQAVSALLRHVSDALIVPRFKHLDDGDVHQKSRGDYVTIADREAEAAITRALRAGDPDHLVIGEEAIASDATLLDMIDIAPRMWLIDPLDGTANFISGNADFGVMVVELVSGRPERSWIWQSMHRHMFFASRGTGAFLDESPLAQLAAGGSLAGGVTQEFSGLSGPGIGNVIPMTGTCTMDYPLIATGDLQFLIHNNKNPWDHYPGILLLERLGGVVRFMDGEPFSSTSRNRHKLIAACSSEAWATVAEAALAMAASERSYAPD